MPTYAVRVQGADEDDLVLESEVELEPGDVFQLSGRTWRVTSIDTMTLDTPDGREQVSQLVVEPV
jgi:Lhr-like helicase